MGWTAAGFTFLLLLVSPATKVCPFTAQAKGSCLAPQPVAPAPIPADGWPRIWGDGYRSFTPELPRREIAFDPAVGWFQVVDSPGTYWLDGATGRAGTATVQLSVLEQRRLLADLPVKITVQYRDARGRFSAGSTPSSLEVGLAQSPGLLRVVLARRHAIGLP